MKVYFLIGILISVITLSSAGDLVIDYPQETILYGETTLIQISVKNIGDTIQIVLPLIQTMNRGIDIQTFTSVLIPGDEVEFFVTVKKPIDDGNYFLIIKTKNGEEYHTYQTLTLQLINPKQTLEITSYHASIAEEKTFFEIELDNKENKKDLTFVFTVSDLYGGREIKEDRFIDIENKTFSFVFNLGRKEYNSERVSSFRIEYDYSGDMYSTDENQIRLGSVNEYAAYISEKKVVYDMYVDKETYKSKENIPITGYTPLKTGGAITLCKAYSEGSFYDKMKLFIPFELLLPSVKSGKLIEGYDTLNFRIKNKVCVYPESGMLTITLLMIIIGTIILLGLNTVEPYELY